MTADAIDENTIEGLMSFAVDTGSKPFNHRAHLDPETGPARFTGIKVYARMRNRNLMVFEKRRVTLRNGRQLRDNLSLDEQGFLQMNCESEVTNFFDENQLQNIYYNECMEMVKEITGVDEVANFQHIIRMEDGKKRNLGKKFRAPLRVAHNDYTNLSAPKRVRDTLPPDEAEERMKGRYIIVNIWRPLMEPVVSWPLVLCDAKSLSPKDLIAADHIYPERRDQSYRMAYNEGQKWFYFPYMGMNEIALFKCFDSSTDGQTRFTAHGSAQLSKPPPPSSKPRESIEVRMIGFYNS